MPPSLVHAWACPVWWAGENTTGVCVRVCPAPTSTTNLARNLARAPQPAHAPCTALHQQQVVQLCDRLVSMHQQQPEVPSVVAGDFNVCPQVLGRGGYDDGGQYHHLATNVGRVGLRDLYSAQESEATQEEATLDHIFLVGTLLHTHAPTGSRPPSPPPHTHTPPSHPLALACCKLSLPCTRAGWCTTTRSHLCVHAQPHDHTHSCVSVRGQALAGAGALPHDHTCVSVHCHTITLTLVCPCVARRWRGLVEQPPQGPRGELWTAAL